ncbi:MAG: helix-turn-helix domain-containing protein [Oscillospiraceae bacterium]|nr:helix-turn-helix domain-containing protein [Oscillospiraceae bacterium]
MKEISQRIRALRETAKVSQAKIAQMIGTNQSAINRYENSQSMPPPQVLLWYADYFDVSMDYIYARTDKPQGKLYEYNPKISAEGEQFRQFIEMCFDPESPMNEKLKQTLIDMVSKGGKNKS